MQVVQWSSPETFWCALVIVVMVNEVMTLSGPNVCMVQQKYNITKRVKYRAPMSVRTYEWCFSMPPRCSRWSTEMRDLTRLETEERTAEVAVCCPGYKMKDVSCVPICPSGKMGHGCSQDCPPDKWGPNCVHECPDCLNGFCVPSTGECDCEEGWQGESCQISMSTVQAAPALMEELLTTTKSTIKTPPTTKPTVLTTKVATTTISTTTPTPVTTTLTATSKIITLSPTHKTETTPITTLLTKSTSLFKFDNVTTTPFTTARVDTETTQKVPKVTIPNLIYNRTETSEEGTSNNFSDEHVSSTVAKIPITITSTPVTSTSTSNSTTTAPTTTTKTTTKTTITSTPSTFTTISTIPTARATNLSITSPKVTIVLTEDSMKTETTKKPEITTKNYLTTLKVKPKEIWIKPTQKGVPIYIENKVKSNHELTHTKLKSATHKNEATSENTTPKTIIVSIIPTSVSHATFKKIALTTATYLPHKSNATAKINRTEKSSTKSMTPQVSTAIPFTIKLLSTVNIKSSSKFPSRFPQSNTTLRVTSSTEKVNLNATTSEKHTSTTIPISNTAMATSLSTNSMLSTLNAIRKKLNSSTSITIKSPTNKQYINKNSLYETTTASTVSKKNKAFLKDEVVNRTNIKLYADVTTKNVTKTKIQNVKYKTANNGTRQTVYAKQNKTNPGTTQEPPEDETFHILTEPEHITAVMNDREREHTSLDLISVISIAGGVMMAVITVAVIIVMIERCKRPRYEDVRKMNDIRMQVMIDNNDVPPPYVRSIFHTPLPEPPSSANCHYQPISTLDRNLKQFMRPVVVQTISPVMLENFRGILECHYDHLPTRRNHDFGTMPTRCSVSPSMKCDEQLFRQRPLSVAEYTIEAMKCEAKLDVLDTTTSEPLYAEIPCWRPPSEHAIEVLNLNGEAVTEL